jgi:hypothetical protein
VRVPVSWLNGFLSRELTAREIDDLLGEAGITVTGIEAIGISSPRVVAARVEAYDTGPGRVHVALPSRELADLPADNLPLPPPGTMVAVALPGATLFADPARHGLVRVPGNGRPGQAIGRVCTTAELGLGCLARIQVLASDAEPGLPLAPLFPVTQREQVLALRIPDALAHCRSLSGLAHEINSRLDGPAPVAGTPWTEALVLTDGSLDVRLTVPDLVACAVLLPALPGNADPVIDWRLPALAGLEADTELDQALLVAAFEYGAHLSTHVMPADGPVAVRIGPGFRGARHAGLGVHVAPGPLERSWGDGQLRLLVLSTGSADLPGGLARCQQAAERVIRLLCPRGQGAQGHAVVALGPKSTRHCIALDPAEFTAKAGLAVGAARCSELLSTIGADAAMTQDGLLDVAVPSSRPDLTTSDALMAELIRLLGFAALPATAPEDPVRPQPDRRYRALAAVRQVLASHRLHEVITPLVRTDAQPIVGDGPDTPWSAGALPLAETAGDGVGWLRRSLVPGLVQTALHQVPSGMVYRLYEMGTVVVPSAGTAERCFLAILRSTPAAPPDSWPPTWEEEYWDVLDAASAAVRTLDVGELRASVIDDPRFHSGTGALLSVSGLPVGHLGALCPVALPRLKTERIRLVAAELDLDSLLRLPGQPRMLTTPPRFPVIERDISLVLPDDTPAQQVLAALSGAGPLLRSAGICTVYRDPRRPDEPRVMTVRLTLGSPWRTLGKQEAAAAVEQAMLMAKSAGAVPRCPS